MKKILSVSLLSAAILSPMAAHAATAELKLIGTITPAACVPNFTGGNTIDYGNITANSLNSTEQTLLPEKNTKLNIVCDAPVRFALKATDERASSLIDTLTTVVGTSTAQKFGLGAAAGGIKIGAYSLNMSNQVPDTGAAFKVVSLDGGATWIAFNSGNVYNNGSAISFSSTNAGAPTAFTSMTVDVRIVAAVDKTSNLPITDEITIDGLSTFEVVYL